MSRWILVLAVLTAATACGGSDTAPTVVNAGSLFLAFKRLERDGMVAADWRDSENNRRAKYYRITEAGRKQLKADARDWERRAAAVARLLSAT